MGCIWTRPFQETGQGAQKKEESGLITTHNRNDQLAFSMIHAYHRLMYLLKELLSPISHNRSGDVHINREKAECHRRHTKLARRRSCLRRYGAISGRGSRAVAASYEGRMASMMIMVDYTSSAN